MSTSTAADVGRAFTHAARRELGKSLAKIEHCLDQLDDEQTWWRPNDSANSIANLVLHLCGNLRQWVVSGVGGAADVRQRPQEFSQRSGIAKAELLSQLKETVREVDEVLARDATAAELLSPRRIQGFDETVLTAIFDSISHFTGHTQEIVHITRNQLGDAYTFHWQPTTKEAGA